MIKHLHPSLRYLLAVIVGCILYKLYRDEYEAKTKVVNSWIQSINQGSNQWNAYSQLGEDGIIDTIFKNIGTTNKIYVEFGVEDCMSQCNTKYLRETGWDVKNSLLMDGGHSNQEINLQQVIFWPSNIISHFETFGVRKEFDFLSVDTDSYDWFMLETIFKAGYKPRVVAVEINASFGIEDAKSILPPADGKSFQRWDGTAYHGSSILGLNYLFNRFSYSLIYCNYINCFAVRDEALGAYIRRPFADVYVPQPENGGHRCDYSNRSMAVIDPSGMWLGDTDEGLGSPRVRHTGCVPGVPDKKPYIEDIPQAEDNTRLKLLEVKP